MILNDTDVGYTPCEVDFTWFGSYEVRLAHPGYEPMREVRTIDAPLHEQPGIDFLAMLTPGKKSTRVDWHFVMTPSQGTDEGLILRARELKMSVEE